MCSVCIPVISGSLSFVAISALGFSRGIATQAMPSSPRAVQPPLNAHMSPSASTSAPSSNPLVGTIGLGGSGPSNVGIIVGAGGGADEGVTTTPRSTPRSTPQKKENKKRITFPKALYLKGAAGDGRSKKKEKKKEKKKS